ncbi:MAG TPA: hypothetical protein PL060_02015, partial [bacterium]|nr:hypothetical protein [bacterium]
VFPLCKRGIKGDFRNLPQPLFAFLVFPLCKRGIKGDFRNLPQPLFYKEGRYINEVIKREVM